MKALLLLLTLVGVALPALAHEVRPAFLQLTERAAGEFEVLWKVPAAGGMVLAGEEIPHEAAAAGGARPAYRPPLPLTMPCGCPAPTHAQLAGGVLPIHPSLPADAISLEPPRVERLPGAEVRHWVIRTGPRGLDGWQVTIHGLPATMVDVLVRIALRDGRVVSRMLRPDAPSFTYSGDLAGPPASGYFLLGVEHILLGWDHLLFVLCLLLLVPGWGPVLRTVTAFTLAHSVTLGLATLGWVRVPQAPVEAVIALSIVLLAAEIARGPAGRMDWSGRRAWGVAFGFGLLHGFGFAGALSEVGLPAREIPAALLLFNLGVEAGQVLFVAGVLLLRHAARGLSRDIPGWLRPVPAYAMGSVSSGWLISRLWAFW